ncbi:hypothetical protein FPG87_13020 [Flavobacterium psychrophilum]|uniref:hypothetical protein n=1 Tax=Flavobacterium psychrophilum TaxID=96345 RepID=UPI0009042952|nr:hypothetical protein [Flavobacterium psychrophilum]MBF2092073.1 hypothetical protein [Flavobacterium psychrophilum]OJH12246.1 hypothetical protein FPG87_13020 [Flavobacterium psychrophilum]
MFNKKKEAIKILDSLLTEIETINDVKQGNNWKSKLKDTLNLYVGENSAISKRLNSLYFTRKETKVYTNAIGFYDVHIYDDSLKEDFRDLIRNAKDYVQSNGVYKNPDKKNFLSHFNNAEIIGGIVVAVGIIYGIGSYFGKLEKDREIFQNETKMQEVEKKSESLTLENNNLKQENDSLKKVTSNLTSKTMPIMNKAIKKK